MRIVTAAQMRAMEGRAHDAGMSYEAMMGNAGGAVAEVVDELCQGADGKRVVVLVGPGNNGGDGLVAARDMSDSGRDVAVYVWRRRAADALVASLVEQGVPLTWTDDDPDLTTLAEWTAGADVIVDALLGTGATDPLRGNLPAILAKVRQVVQGSAEERRPIVAPGEPSSVMPRPTVVAVDLPSGMDADTGEIDPLALAADVTVTFAAAKPGHFRFPGAERVGRLMVADIGLGQDVPKAPILLDGDLISEWLPKRPAGSHKGTYGKAMVVAGSANYVGAAAMSTEAAYRAGAGLVTLATPTAIYPLIASTLREATYLMLPGTLGVLGPSAVPLLIERVQGYDALLLGPGLSSEETTAEFVAGILAPQRAPIHSLGYRAIPSLAPEAHLPPMVIDADGLNHLSAMEGWYEQLPESCILTPHPGEMSRLSGLSTAEVQARRWELASETAERWGCVVVLKGAFTAIAAPGRDLLVSPFATPALAVAGSGDVLAGTIVGLLAQGLEPCRAAACGVYLHGLAGAMLEKRVGAAGGLAGELLPLIPEAIASLCRNTTP